jgi:hypothetical protein
MQSKNNAISLRKTSVKIDGSHFITLAPNPSTTQFTIGLTEAIPNFTQLIINDISGKKVLVLRVEPGTTQLEVNHTLIAGIYFVQVGKHSLKLVVN